METTHSRSELQLNVRNMPTLVELLKQVLNAAHGVDEGRERRLRVSRNAVSPAEAHQRTGPC